MSVLYIRVLAHKGYISMLKNTASEEIYEPDDYKNVH